MSHQPLNFLISSAGRRGELVQIFREVIAASGNRGGVFAVDRSPLTAAGWLSDGLDLVPLISDPAFIGAVLDVCKRRAITHLIPTIDTELPIYSASRDTFAEAGINLWVSGKETVKIARDKRMTNVWLEKHGFPTVRQWDLEGALNGDTDDLPLPLIAKPASGSSSLGLTRITHHSQLALLDPSLDYVLETIAPGREHTVDVLVSRHGHCKAAVPRRRLETRAGEVSKGLTVRDIGLIELATEVAEQLPDAYGVLNIQIFQDLEKQALNVIEINARFGGGFPLTWAAGAQLPLWLALEYAGDIPGDSLLVWTANKLMLRYDAATYLDVQETLE